MAAGAGKKVVGVEGETAGGVFFTGRQRKADG